MDRRAALAKLAGGAAAGAGAVLVQSSAAFADYGSVFCRPTDCTTPFGMNLVLIGMPANSDYLQATMSAPSFGCAPGYSSSVRYKYRIVRVGNGNAPRVSDCGSSATLATAGVWTPFLSSATVCIKNGNSNSNLNNGTYRLEVIERRICSNGVRSCWCCIGQSRTFVMAGNTLPPPTPGSFAVSNALCN